MDNGGIEELQMPSNIIGVHSFLTHSCDGSSFCLACHGGIQHCIKCGCVEDELPHSCPEFKISDDFKKLIAQDKLDFIEGNWISLTHFTHGE